jgi:hypothetical protein
MSRAPSGRQPLSCSPAFAATEASIAIRPPLKETLRFGPNHLVEEIASFVDIVVLGYDPAMLTECLFGPETTSPEGGNYRTLVATRVAVNQHSAVGILEAER